MAGFSGSIVRVRQGRRATGRDRLRSRASFARTGSTIAVVHFGSLLTLGLLLIIPGKTRLTINHLKSISYPLRVTLWASRVNRSVERLQKIAKKEIALMDLRVGFNRWRQ
jgi:hypothetical protein